jgi:hypothetical protein
MFEKPKQNQKDDNDKKKHNEKKNGYKGYSAPQLLQNKQTNQIVVATIVKYWQSVIEQHKQKELENFLQERSNRFYGLSYMKSFALKLLTAHEYFKSNNSVEIKYDIPNEDDNVELNGGIQIKQFIKKSWDELLHTLQECILRILPAPEHLKEIPTLKQKIAIIYDELTHYLCEINAVEFKTIFNNRLRAFLEFYFKGGFASRDDLLGFIDEEGTLFVKLFVRRVEKQISLKTIFNEKINEKSKNSFICLLKGINQCDQLNIKDYKKIIKFFNEKGDVSLIGDEYKKLLNKAVCRACNITRVKLVTPNDISTHIQIIQENNKIAIYKNENSYKTRWGKDKQKYNIAVIPQYKNESCVGYTIVDERSRLSKSKFYEKTESKFTDAGDAAKRFILYDEFHSVTELNMMSKHLYLYRTIGKYLLNHPHPETTNTVKGAKFCSENVTRNDVRHHIVRMYVYELGEKFIFIGESNEANVAEDKHIKVSESKDVYPEKIIKECEKQSGKLCEIKPYNNARQAFLAKLSREKPVRNHLLKCEFNAEIVVIPMNDNKLVIFDRRGGGVSSRDTHTFWNTLDGISHKHKRRNGDSLHEVIKEKDIEINDTIAKRYDLMSGFSDNKFFENKFFTQVFHYFIKNYPTEKLEGLSSVIEYGELAGNLYQTAENTTNHLLPLLKQIINCHDFLHDKDLQDFISFINKQGVICVKNVEQAKEINRLCRQIEVILVTKWAIEEIKEKKYGDAYALMDGFRNGKIIKLSLSVKSKSIEPRNLNVIIEAVRKDCEKVIEDRLNNALKSKKFIDDITKEIGKFTKFKLFTLMMKNHEFKQMVKRVKFAKILQAFEIVLGKKNENIAEQAKYVCFVVKNINKEQLKCYATDIAKFNQIISWVASSNYKWKPAEMSGLVEYVLNSEFAAKEYLEKFAGQIIIICGKYAGILLQQGMYNDFIQHVIQVADEHLDIFNDYFDILLGLSQSQKDIPVTKACNNERIKNKIDDLLKQPKKLKAARNLILILGTKEQQEQCDLNLQALEIVKRIEETSKAEVIYPIYQDAIKADQIYFNMVKDVIEKKLSSVIKEAYSDEKLLEKINEICKDLEINTEKVCTGYLKLLSESATEKNLGGENVVDIIVLNYLRIKYLGSEAQKKQAKEIITKKLPHLCWFLKRGSSAELQAAKNIEMIMQKLKFVKLLGQPISYEDFCKIPSLKNKGEMFLENLYNLCKKYKNTSIEQLQDIVEIEFLAKKQNLKTNQQRTFSEWQTTNLKIFVDFIKDCKDDLPKYDWCKRVRSLLVKEPNPQLLKEWDNALLKIVRSVTDNFVLIEDKKPEDSSTKNKESDKEPEENEEKKEKKEKVETAIKLNGAWKLPVVTQKGGHSKNKKKKKKKSRLIENFDNYDEVKVTTVEKNLKSEKVEVVEVEKVDKVNIKDTFVENVLNDSDNYAQNNQLIFPCLSQVILFDIKNFKEKGSDPNDKIIKRLTDGCNSIEQAVKILEELGKEEKKKEKKDEKVENKEENKNAFLQKLPSYTDCRSLWEIIVFASWYAGLGQTPKNLYVRLFHRLNNVIYDLAEKCSEIDAPKAQKFCQIAVQVALDNNKIAKLEYRKAEKVKSIATWKKNNAHTCNLLVTYKTEIVYEQQNTGAFFKKKQKKKQKPKKITKHIPEQLIFKRNVCEDFIERDVQREHNQKICEKMPTQKWAWDTKPLLKPCRDYINEHGKLDKNNQFLPQYDKANQFMDSDLLKKYEKLPKQMNEQKQKEKNTNTMQNN